MDLDRPKKTLINPDIFFIIKASIPKSLFYKLSHRMRLVSRNHIVIRPFFLKHQPHRLDIILRITPISLSIQISQIEFILESHFNPSDGHRYLTSHESLTPPGGLVIKKDPVTSEHAISFSIIHGCPVGKKLGYRVGTDRLKRCFFVLRSL